MIVLSIAVKSKKEIEKVLKKLEKQGCYRWNTGEKATDYMPPSPTASIQLWSDNSITYSYVKGYADTKNITAGEFLKNDNSDGSKAVARKDKKWERKISR